MCALQGCAGLKGVTDTQKNLGRGTEQGKKIHLLNTAQGCILGDCKNFSATAVEQSKPQSCLGSAAGRAVKCHTMLRATAFGCKGLLDSGSHTEWDVIQVRLYFWCNRSYDWCTVPTF